MDDSGSGFIPSTALLLVLNWLWMMVDLICELTSWFSPLLFSKRNKSNVALSKSFMVKKEFLPMRCYWCSHLGCQLWSDIFTEIFPIKKSLCHTHWIVHSRFSWILNNMNQQYDKILWLLIMVKMLINTNELLSVLNSKSEWIFVAFTWLINYLLYNFPSTWVLQNNNMFYSLSREHNKRVIKVIIICAYYVNNVNEQHNPKTWWMIDFSFII